MGMGATRIHSGGRSSRCRCGVKLYVIVFKKTEQPVTVIHDLRIGRILRIIGLGAAGCFADLLLGVAHKAAIWAL